MKMGKIVLFLVIVVFYFSTPGWAACAWEGSVGTAASCSRADVADCLDDEEADTGATIILPTCKTPPYAEYSTKITITKELTIQGQGIGNTIIRNTNTTASDAGIFEFAIASNTSTSSRLTGMTIYGPSSASTSSWTIEISGDENFRIDNVLFTQDGYMAGNAISIWWPAHGVINSCSFASHATEQISARGNAANHDTYWGIATDLGTANATYVEGCIFTDPLDLVGHSVTCNEGSRCVVRYSDHDKQDIDFHGYCFNGCGTRQFEVYNNIRTGDYEYGIFVRGGTGVIYNNECNPDHYFFGCIRLTDYRVKTNCSNGNCCSTNEGYPCLDQVGRGQNQGSEPVYIWGNTNNSTWDKNNSQHFAVSNTGSNCEAEDDISDYIQEDRDYIFSTKGGYTAYTCPHPLTGLTGTCGVGAGTSYYNMQSGLWKLGTGAGVSLGSGAGMKVQ